MSRENIHTVYDRMNAKGFFATNPANREARDKLTGESLYSGPIPFPKMLYHPNGKTKITVPAVAENTPFGPEYRGEQREIISKIVNNSEELKTALADGWHEHPADSFNAGLTEEQKAAGVKAPAKSSAQRVSSLEEQVARLTAELAAAKSGRIQDDSAEEEEE